MGGRVDHPDALLGAPQDVAVPEVAVEPGRRLLGHQLGQPGDDALDALGVVGGDAPVVAGELEVGQHPALGEELRPRRGGLVEHRQPRDEAVGVAAVRRRAGLVGGRQRAAETGRRVGRRPAGLDPAQDQAAVVGGQHVGHAHAAGLAQPRQPGGLAGEELRRRVVEGLHQRRGAVGEAQLGGHAHVAAVDRSGRDDGGAEELLGVPGDQRLARHRAAPEVSPTASASRSAREAEVRSTIVSTSSNPASPP